jgi:hypothetical protein
MPMGKPVPAQDPYPPATPPSVAEAVKVNKTSSCEAAAPDGYKGQTK